MYSIWVCQHAKVNRDTVTRYRMRKEDMVGSAAVDEREYDLLQVIMVCLGQVDSAQTDLLHFLNVAFSDDMEIEQKMAVLQEQHGIAMTEPMDKELTEMCNLSLGLIERGIEQGIDIGEKRAEKRAEKQWSETILELVKSGELSVDGAAHALKKSVAEIRALLEME